MSTTAPQDFLIGIILMSMVVSAAVLVMGAFINDNPSMDTENLNFNFNRSYNKLAEASAAGNSIRSGLTNASNSNRVTVLENIFNAGYNTLVSFVTSLGFVSDFFAGFDTLLGLPNFVGSGLLSIVIITVVFGVLYALLKINT
jgi:hypothetical protein